MNENQNEYVDINAHDSYPDSDQKIEIPTMKVIPLKKICMTIGELPSSYLETMTYYEMLVWFINFLRNNVIPTVNNNGEAVEELQQVVMNLQTYINNYKDSIDQDVEDLEEYMNNYFENLDVQEEINNKLDQMLEDGVLEQIIEQFLQLTSLICFDNVADMKNSLNLTNGSYAKTLGYYSKNDGGSSLYKIRTITNDDVVDEQFIIEMINDNTLIAELIINEDLNSKQLGIYGDGINDDTLKINNALNKVNHLNFINGNYLISDTINMNNNKLIKSKGKFIYNGDRTKPAILISGRYNNIELYDIVDINSANDPLYDGGWHGWENSSYSAIEIRDVSYSTISFNKIANFTTGVKFNGLTSSGLYKTILNGYEIYNCKYGIYFKATSSAWINNDIINKIMINYGAGSGDFHNHANPISKYGVYQENVEGDTAGIRYMEFNNMFFEIMNKDNFTCFYFNLCARSEFNMCIPEIKSGNTYAEFYIKNYLENPYSLDNHSNRNIFYNCNAMGGNNNIIFSNTKKVMCSLPEIAKHDNIHFNKIYSENNLIGKMVKIDDHHMTIKGYAFSPLNANITSLDSCQIARTDYYNVTIDWDKNCLNIPAGQPLSLIIPCSLNDTFRITLNGDGSNDNNKGNLYFKCYNASGELIDGVENDSNKLAGYFTYNESTKNFGARAGKLNNIDFTVVDSSVKYILIYVCEYVNGFTIYKIGYPATLKKFCTNLKHLNILGDVGFSPSKPTSTADTDSVIKNQRVYNSNVANLGEYWTFDGTSWN